MHGIIFLQLQKFIKASSSPEVFSKIMDEAKLRGKFFDATKAYPDEELVAIFSTTCKTLNLDPEVALEEFGKFITPSLLTTYKPYIKNEWGCMDLLENIESTIHRVVRASNAGASPPELVITRINPAEVQIDYTSKRKMISLGIGIIKKIAEHYNEQITISKTAIPNGTRLKVSKSAKTSK
ncbi:MAG: heme NO-binding domain-containing protein [Bacteroidetes bacterium]|nr:heme NO-binding domain-containing protein [Bacteroidota bacterium]